jgi:cytochrome c oxidase cbb3-type subunit IV
MDVNTLRIAATIGCFAVFLGILAWAYARRNRNAFDDAAQIPFTGEPQGTEP